MIIAIKDDGNLKIWLVKHPRKMDINMDYPDMVFSAQSLKRIALAMLKGYPARLITTPRSRQSSKFRVKSLESAFNSRANQRQESRQTPREAKPKEHFEKPNQKALKRDPHTTLMQFLLPPFSAL